MGCGADVTSHIICHVDRHVTCHVSTTSHVISHVIVHVNLHVIIVIHVITVSIATSSSMSSMCDMAIQFMTKINVTNNIIFITDLIIMSHIDDMEDDVAVDMDGNDDM